jgi:hypothetical protein
MFNEPEFDIIIVKKKRQFEPFVRLKTNAVPTAFRRDVVAHFLNA